MRYILPVLLSCISLVTLAQYKNDNVLFKTVYIEDLCASLKNTPNAILLDVRSKGEYDDTSTFSSLNIGRLKNTIHLDIQEMNTRWRELLPHKDKPIYVMCSHSQRSRRVSKMLADSGFANIINVNGGLTTYNLLPGAAVCEEQLYQTANKYKLVSPLELCGFLTTSKDLFILDVRSDSVFKAISLNERLNFNGKINGAVNIPFATLNNSLSKLPSGKKILVVDDTGTEAARAAKMLSDNGYADVHVLLNGMNMLAERSRNEVVCMDKMISRTAGYQVITADEMTALLRKEKDLKIIDVRPADEFNNQSAQAFRNMGRVRNAVNIPVADLEKRISEAGDKNKPVLLYQFSGGGFDAYQSAKLLSGQGFRRVYVLSGGLFNIRWQAANLKRKSHLKDMVVDIPAENL